jgi:hypothetical protein
MIIDRISGDQICEYVNLRKEFIAKPHVRATRRPDFDATGDLSSDWVRRWESRFFEISYVVYACGTPIAWIEYDGTVVKVSGSLPSLAAKKLVMISAAL